MEAIIKYCAECAKKNITHDFQDSQYGKFFRLMNPIGKGDGEPTRWRCTTCSGVTSKETNKKETKK